MNERANHETIQRLHTDLMVFALSSGYTRVAVLQVGDRQDDHEYVIDGVSVQFRDNRAASNEASFGVLRETRGGASWGVGILSFRQER